MRDSAAQVLFLQSEKLKLSVFWKHLAGWTTSNAICEGSLEYLMTIIRL